MFDDLNFIANSSESAKSQNSPKSQVLLERNTNTNLSVPRKLNFISDTDSSDNENEVPEWKTRLEEKLAELSKNKKVDDHSVDPTEMLKNADDKDKRICSKEFVSSSDSDSEPLVKEPIKTSPIIKRKPQADDSDSSELNLELAEENNEEMEEKNKRKKVQRKKKSKLSVATNEDEEEPMRPKATPKKLKNKKADSKDVAKRTPKPVSKKANMANKLETNKDTEMKDAKCDNDGEGLSSDEVDKEPSKEDEVPKTPKSKSKKRKRDDGDGEVPPGDDEMEKKDNNDDEEPSTSTPTSKRRRVTKTGDDPVEFRLKKLRKCAHNAGIIPPYKKLFENIEDPLKQIKVLENFLIEKMGIERPITIEKCHKYKIQREIEMEKRSLANNIIFENETGRRVTRSTRQSAVIRRNAIIDDSDNNDDDDDETDSESEKETNLFAGLAGIVSSDDDE